MLASVPLVGLLPATAILNAAGDEALEAVAAGELRPVYVPARPAERARAGVDGRGAVGLAARRGAPGERRGWRGDARRRRCRSSPTRRARSCWSWSVRPATASRSRWPCPPAASGVSIEREVRYDATRSLGHRAPLRRARPGARRRCRGSHRRVVPGPGADRRRVARSGADLSGDERRLRQGALHLRPGDRLLSGDQARADRGASPPGEQPRPPVLRRLGPRRQARGVPARRERGAGGGGARHSMSPAGP